MHFFLGMFLTLAKIRSKCKFSDPESKVGLSLIVRYIAILNLKLVSLQNVLKPFFVA